MAERVPETGAGHGIGPLEASAGAWRHAPVLIASIARHRYRGLRPWSLGAGLLMSGRSVHGVGMAEPLTVVALGDDAEVVAVRRLRRGRLMRLPGASAVLELPERVAAPPLGAVVTFRPMLDRCLGA